MHEGGSWSAWLHYFPGFGHTPTRLLVWLLILLGAVGLIWSLFSKKDRVVRNGGGKSTRKSDGL